MLVLQELIKPGAYVKKGTVVAEFDRQYMLNRLDDYRAGLDQTEAGLKILKANLEVDKKAHQQSIGVAKAEWDKAQLDLKTIPVQSAIDSERLKLAEEEAAARYKQLLSEVNYKDVSQQTQWKMSVLNRDQSKIELQRSEANADRMVVRAPMDGVTVMLTTFRGGEFGQIQQGDMLYPGQLYMRIVEPGSMVVNASVNQADIEMMRIGAHAKVRFDAYPNLELPAHLYSIGAMPRAGGFRASYVKEVPVVLKLDKLDPRVIPDLSVSADIVVAREEKAAIAPLEAVFTEAGTGKPFAFLRRPSGWERRPVEVGLTNNVAAVVLSGVRPGEVVAAEWPIKETKK
jgi:HlyD family secretion protein